MATVAVTAPSETPASGHRLWVRCVHWLLAASVLTLMVSGVLILMVHPRLYWGEIGNDLTPALVELPLGRNYRHGGWEATAPFTRQHADVVSAARTYDIYNENGWARSLHFLAAWGLVGFGFVYAAAGSATGHLRRTLLPTRRELGPRVLWRDAADHLRLRIAPSAGPPYGPLQKLAYVGTVFVLLPAMVLTGLAMSPAVAAATGLPELFGGSQSARTIHFAAFAAVLLFLAVHIAMILLTGPRWQLRAMIRGS